MFVSPHLGHPSRSKIAVVVLRALVGGGLESGLAILHFVWQPKYRCPANVSMQDLTPFPLSYVLFRVKSDCICPDKRPKLQSAPVPLGVGDAG
jgi:hypothetical protein